MALDGFIWPCTQAQSAWQRPNADSRAICEINFQPNDPIRTVSRRSNLSFAAGARGDDHDAMLDRRNGSALTGQRRASQYPPRASARYRTMAMHDRSAYQNRALNVSGVR